MKQINEKLTDIDNMIRRENDEEKRNVLLVLHCLTSTLSSVSRVLEELEKHHCEQFNDHEDRINEHDDIVLKSKTTWNISLGFVGVIQTMLVAALMYGFSLFSEVQQKVAQNSDRILVIEQTINKHVAKITD